MKFKLFGWDFECPPFNLPLFLAITTTLGFFSLLGDICFREVPTGSKEIAFAMLGSVGSAWTGLIGYYFGSSAGSARKTEMLAQPTTSTTTTTPTTEVKTVTEPKTEKKDGEA